MCRMNHAGCGHQTIRQPGVTPLKSGEIECRTGSPRECTTQMRIFPTSRAPEPPFNTVCNLRWTRGSPHTPKHGVRHAPHTTPTNASPAPPLKPRFRFALLKERARLIKIRHLWTSQLRSSVDHLPRHSFHTDECQNRPEQGGRGGVRRTL